MNRKWHREKTNKTRSSRNSHEDRQFAKITHLFPYVSKNQLCARNPGLVNKGSPHALPLTKVTHEA